PVVPSYSNTPAVTRPPPTLPTKRSPLGPKTSPVGLPSPDEGDPPPVGTKTRTNAPVVPLYSNTPLPPEAPLPTKRSPLAPKTSPVGLFRLPGTPLIPVGTKIVTNAPVVPLYSNTLLGVLTKRFPLAPKTS